MAQVQTGNAFGMAVLKALGIPAKHILSVSISMEPDHLATVTVTRALFDEEAGEILKTFDAYVLVQKPEDPAATAMQTVAANLLKG